MTTVHPKIAFSFAVLCINVKKKRQNTVFWLQKGVKNGFQDRIRIRDPEIVYGYIYYFSPKVIGT